MAYGDKSPFFTQAFGGIPQGKPKRVPLVACEGKPALRPPSDYSGLRLRRTVTMDQPLCTPRQMEVWRLLALGYAGKEIAAQLKMSIKTYDCHLALLKRAVGARNHADLTRAAIAAGVIEVEVRGGKEKA
jgi:DNA-binding CsgD family transcriptional regulator